MTFPTPITASQANKETPIGEMFRGLKWAALFSDNPAATTGLVFGLNGGPMLVDGVLTVIADQTVTCTVSTTNYVETTRAGVASVNTTGFSAGKVPLFVVTTSASGIASMVDWRTWQALPGVTGRLSLSVAGGADVTLSAAQARCEILNFTGALTANINVIVPTGPQRWVVSNNTTGAYSLTVKTAAGTGIACVQGAQTGVVADGTNVVSSSSGGGAVTSVAGRTGAVTLAASDISDLDTDGTLAANSDTKIASQKAVKTAIAAAVAGLSWKQAVRAATTANGALATAYANGQIIDGVTLATGDRILLKNQTAGAENGIYVVAASGAPARAADADSGAELVNASVYVSEGTTLADTQWTCTTNATITVGTTALAFAQLTSGGSGVSSVAASGGLQTTTGSPITASGTIQGAHVINAQTGTSYAVVATDRGAHVTLSNAASIAVTLPQAGTTGFENGWYCYIQNVGVGSAVITPTTSTINGLTSLLVNNSMAFLIVSDGTNYTTIGGEAAGLNPNLQTTTSYTFIGMDRKRLVTFSNASAIAATLPQATGNFGVSWWVFVQNRGVGTLTITPTTSTIDGASSLALTTGQGCIISSDGTNYFTMRGIGSASGGSNAAAYNSATTAEVFGDSYTTGNGASDSAHAWPQLFAASRGWTLTNSAVSGSAVADQAQAVFTKTVANGSQSLYQLGTNDARNYSSVGQMTSFKKMHAASIAWLAIPRANLTLGINASQSGTWANMADTWTTGVGIVSATDGSTATFTTMGTVAYLGYIIQTGNTSTFSVTVDGVNYGVFNVGPDGATSMTTGLGKLYGPALARFAGLSEGAHTVVVTVVSHGGTGGSVYLIYAAGNQGHNTKDGPNVFVGNVPRLNSTGYAASTTGSDTAFAYFNDMIRDNVSALASDGLNITLADHAYSLLPASDLAVDGIHPNDSGHQKIANAYISAVNQIAKPKDAAPPRRDRVQVNAQTGTSYTYRVSDRGVLVTQSNASASAGTLPQAVLDFGPGWFCYVVNNGAGTHTITPTTSTINGSSTLALTTGQGALIVSNESGNYDVFSGGSTGGSSTPTTTKGDLIVRSSTADARLPVGADTYQLIADSTQTLGVKWAPASASAGASSSAGPSGTAGRLTLESGVPVSTTDQTAKTTIYWTPYKGNQVQLWDGSAWTTYTSAEISLALGTMTASIGYDVFMYQNSGVPALEKLAWTSATARATAVTLQDGRYCKSGDKTRLYLGSFYATTTTSTDDSQGGTTTQVGGKRFLWNNYNRVTRIAAVKDTTANWSYNTGTVRQANGASGNKVEYFIGLAEEAVSARLAVRVNAVNNSTRANVAGIGYDSTSAMSSFGNSVYTNSTSVSISGAIQGVLDVMSAVGYHYLAWLESGGDGTNSWAGSQEIQGGLSARIAG